MAASEKKATVPRNFRLLYELEAGEKGIGEEKVKHASSPWVSYGLDGDDILLSHWQGTIIGPQNTNLGEYIFNVKITCGPQYPDKPPTIKFVEKITMDCVDASGYVSNKLPILASWKRDYGIKEILYQLHEMMVPASKNKQPAPGTLY